MAFSKRRNRSSSFTYLSLEHRRVLTTITLNDCALKMVGTTENDQVEIFDGGNQEDDLRVTDLVNEVVFKFPKSDVTENFIGIGGPGNDTITVRSPFGQPELVYGGPDNDVITIVDSVGQFFGQEGNDEMIGSPQDDRLNGGPGDDIIRGRGGNDVLLGVDGNDQLFGNEGNDTLQGYLGNDKLYGGPGADLLVGGEGDDVLNGYFGTDVLLGQAGSDRLVPGAGGIMQTEVQATISFSLDQAIERTD